MLKYSSSQCTAFFLKRVLPVIAFAIAVMFFARLILPTTPAAVHCIITGVCTAWLVADKALSKGGES
jgi:uncharacterized membrane protein